MIGMGYRTIKTAVGAGLAIWIASLFHLEFATFAAIIVIMCIEKTRKKSLDTILKKFFACLLSLVLSGIVFEIFGYNPLVFSIFILLFVPLLVKAKIQGGFVTSMVVVLHIYTVKHANVEVFLNEFFVIVIGISIAILVNSYMPSAKDDIENFKAKIENSFQVILYELAAYLRDSKQNWDGKEILEAEDWINQAKSIAMNEMENHLLKKQVKDFFYLEMREDQLELLKRMLPIVSSLSLHLKQREIFADFLEFLSNHVHSGDTTELSFQKLEECWELMRETELPTTREEFETRANLYYLIREIENYLHIKRKLFSKREYKGTPKTEQ
ncbi:aromatic acid exporter family protein [Caldibacillus lycopersici]|uniref:Aromatic acid exporter family protein n=1 Tax=Perspicuibacillus lycopersici TaxID=1325689 RepID=A0AAE3IWM1_9BACI|nr:aromatic acid exporter family protein [Perspicuibacillus lycopersici]MCU9614943.1 aromatic acid exporter family protein [Perspicuibacillus lycopersici]